MSRRTLLRGADLPPQICAQCGKRMVMGIVYSVTINGEKFRVCSFECEKALKKEKKIDTD